MKDSQVWKSTNNGCLKYKLIITCTVYLNQRLEIDFKKCFWRIRIIKNKIFKARQKFSNTFKISPLRVLGYIW